MLVCMECNVDDLNPEFYPYVSQRLLEAGAKDVWLTPIIMKHGRPAVQISVLVDSELQQAVGDLLFHETSTIGLRWYTLERRELLRQLQTVSTAAGEIRIKVAFNEAGEELNAAPEHADCLAGAQRSGRPLKEVYRAALIAYEEHKKTMK